jgi:ribonuclease BN (tRNA processing enzyme)
MRLTVLGSSGTHPGPERVCSSYLVEHDGSRLLLDCGNGSLSNLQKRVDVAEVDHVLVTHLHPDHFADLYGLYYALRFHPRGPQRVPLLGPAGTPEFVTQLLSGESVATFGERLPFTAVAAGQRLELGPFTVTLFAAAHPVETLAPRVEAGGRVLAYSADSGPTDALLGCARDADAFLCDTSWLEADGPHPEGVHLSAAQAGELAAAAHAARLICTHIYPTVDPRAIAAEAEAAFGGEVLIAHDLDLVELT